MPSDSAAPRRHILVLGDQLTRSVGPLADADPATTTVLLVRARAWERRRAYHAQKLVLVRSAMRHFADELRGAGFSVAWVETDDAPADAVGAYVAAHPGAPIELMEPADHGVVDALAAAVATAGGALRIVPNALWLTDADDWATFLRGRETKRLRMETWYRMQRARTGWLMTDDGKPVGGEWNLDHENREPPPPAWHPWPAIPPFEPDAITRAEIAAVRAEHPDAPGALEPFWWPVTRADALAILGDFLVHRLRDFGRWEDAITESSIALHHSQLAVPMNLGLITAREVCEAALAHAADPGNGVPLNSIEGFIRQLLGWREYLRHVYRTRMPELRERNLLGHDAPLPAAFTGGTTRMRCVSHALATLDATGWTHHIQRLMVLGNLGLLAGTDPRALTEWFHERYVDAYDWVMVPNVVGMSQFADGDAFVTKPYIAGGRYVDRMSDHCAACPYDPEKTAGPDACPLSTLYWAFVERHGRALRGVGRFDPVVRTWEKRPESDRAAILARAAAVRAGLADGTT
ncbi:MAG: cryptochrome/photolyase family protein [Chloroflexota bacterium]